MYSESLYELWAGELFGSLRPTTHLELDVRVADHHVELLLAHTVGSWPLVVILTVHGKRCQVIHCGQTALYYRGLRDTRAARPAAMEAQALHLRNNVALLHDPLELVHHWL